jgi:hypothetical protein
LQHNLPLSDICIAAEQRRYSITPSARPSSVSWHLVEQASIPFATPLVNSPRHPTSARIERVEREGKKLPPENLLLLAELYASMAGRYQPTNTNPDTGARTPNKKFNEERYAFWLGRWGDALAKAAPYYAPRLMAMAVQNQVQIEDKRARVDPREVMLQIYLEMLRRGELTAKVLEAPRKTKESQPGNRFRIRRGHR